MSSTRKVLVVGSGAREHALALRLLASPSVESVVVCPGNPGTSRAPAPLAHKRLSNAAGAVLDVAREQRPDLVVVGPEAPLCAGVADELTNAGFLVFGPTRAAAELEGSKAFMKGLAVRSGIPTARHEVVQSPSELDAALSRFTAPPVVKADGLCAGKGVVVADSIEEARAAAHAMLSGTRFGAAGKIVVLEERLEGSEASVHAICDGERCFVLPAAQDHKRIGDGDTGPNTGGMGAYAPAPLVSTELTDTIRRRIIEPALRGMADGGRPFRGALFAGLMISDRGEPSLIEFNVRFGDPETEVLMDVLDGDLAEALAQAAMGRLANDALRVAAESSLCVVLAAEGYPGRPSAGDVIDGVERAAALAGVRVYHAGTRLDGDRLITAGGRVLAVTAHGPSLAAAHARAYEAVREIRFRGLQYRTDIGMRALTRSSGAQSARPLP